MGLSLGQERIGSTGGFGSCFVAVVKFDLIRLELEGRFATVILVASLNSNLLEGEIPHFIHSIRFDSLYKKTKTAEDLFLISKKKKNLA